MSRVFNFSAGPATLPESVLQTAASEMTDWHHQGVGVMEMSHRSKAYTSIIEAAEADLRELLAIPDNYKVLFLQGGAHLQFAMVPLNLLCGRKRIDFVDTGAWSKKAMAEAARYADVHVVAEATDHVPPFTEWQLDSEAAYVHICSNETIGGVQYHWLPETGDVPLVADMSSDILSRPIDVSRFGLIYAGAQKNIGPAGLTLVIVREDLLGGVADGTPTVLDYAVHARDGSMYHTPPTYAIYLAGLVFQWLKAQGGLEAMYQRNLDKAQRLYRAIDNSRMYENPVLEFDRSYMNIPFSIKKPDLDATFLSGAAERGLVELKGHRSVGGMRASIYNAMPLAGVDALCEYMEAFEFEHYYA